MPLTPGLERYLTELDRLLEPLGEAERFDIVEETRCHLIERQARMSASEIVMRMGSPRELAAAFLETAEFSAPPPPLTAWRATRFMGAAAFASGAMLWVFAAGLAILCIAELLAPRLVGVWVDSSAGNLFIGAASPEMFANLNDLAGPWLLPLAALLTAFAGAGGSAMVRLALPFWRMSRNAAPGY